MKLFRTKQGNVLEAAGKYYHMDQPWDELVNRDGLFAYLEKPRLKNPIHDQSHK